MKTLLAVIAATLLSTSAFALDLSPADSAFILDFTKSQDRGCKMHGDPKAGFDECVKPGWGGEMIAGCRSGTIEAGEKIFTQMYGAYTSQDQNLFAGVTSSWGHVILMWHFQLLAKLDPDDADIVYYLFLPEGDSYTYWRGKLPELGGPDLRATTPVNFYINAYKSGGKPMGMRARKFFQAYFKGDKQALFNQIEAIKKDWPAIKADLYKGC